MKKRNSIPVAVLDLKAHAVEQRRGFAPGNPLLLVFNSI